MKGAWVVCTTAAIILFMSAADSLAQNAPLSKATKEEILAAVAARPSIEDISVSYSFDAIKAPPNYMGNRMHKDVMLKGNKVYINSAFGGDPSVNSTLFKREVAYNGELSTLHDVNAANALLSRKQEREATAAHVDLLDFARACTPDKGLPGAVHQSLASLLRSPECRLRETAEDVGGRQCLVLELASTQGQAASILVWLDPSRGYLPVRQQYMNRDGKPFMEFLVDDAVEVAKGLWIPLSGTKRVSTAGKGPQDSWEIETILKVDRDSTGKPKLAVNAGVYDAVFDLWKRLPAGTEVLDVTTGASYKVAADTAKVAEESRNAVGETMTLEPEESPEKPASDTEAPAAPATRPAVPEGTGRRSRHIVFLLLAIAAVALPVVVLIVKKNRSRKRQ